ncbi:reverse transcriptase domain-containing protein [Tanacetum coccineum]|uniref:Reverse transcriptase domain-containing protein n=1 Tax=Tanacetum coccineum TaxID=301880 RepID=A0ABQ5APW2_9ASTR
MRTRSQARKRRQQQVRQTSVESPNLEKPNNNQETFNPPIVTMADNITMAQLLEAPTEGYEDAIIVPKITANNFEIKHGLLNLVQNKQFFGHDKEDPHAHIRYFNKITSTMKFPNVPKPPRSILTWDDLVSKFINKFFPPSKTTNLRNEITRFQQRFDESFYEAWDRFNDLLRACPHHGFSELHQLDTFYNALNTNDQDSLNSAAGGNFLDKMPRECLKIIESKSKVRNSRSKPVVAKMSASTSTSRISPDVSELKDMVKALLLDKKNQSQAPAHQTPASVKAVEESCVTCGGAHSYQSCPATDGNVYHDNIQAYVSQACPRLISIKEYHARPPMERTSLLPELTLTCMTLELADRSITEPIGIAKDVHLMVGKFQFLADFVVVDFEPDPRVPLILGRSFLKTSRSLIDVYEGEITLRVGKEAITFNLDQNIEIRSNTINDGKSPNRRH